MKLQKELPIISIALLPLVYLAFIWHSLPEKVPMHWDINGNIDRFGSKTELLLLAFLLPIMPYIILLAVPYIDPKKTIDQNGKIYWFLKLFLTAFMSGLAIIIILSAQNAQLFNPNNILMMIGLLYMFLGWYFPKLSPNYFIGIKTPWTLENEQIWYATHQMAGKLWLLGGLLVVIFSLILETKLNFVLFLVITAIITLLPIVYSFQKYKRLG